MNTPHIEVEEKAGGSVRVTLLSSCQSGCNFCHLEGYKSQDEIGTLNPALAGWRESGKFDNLVSLQDIRNTVEIVKALNLKDVNLTGGEPTLHPELTQIIKLLAEAGFSVAMTTHAEVSSTKFNEYINSGLEWIIVSLHAVTPEQYADMDLVAQQLVKSHSRETTLRYAKNRLRNKLQNVELALAAQQKGILKGVITNTVMLNLNQVKSVISFCNDKRILPRIQRDLNERLRSQKLLGNLIADLNAVCIKKSKAIGDSSGAGFDYQYTDSVSGKLHTFRLKDFGDVYLKTMCDGCHKKNSPFCRERFYGVRVESGRIRTCIDLEQENLTIFDPKDFLYQINIPGTVPAEIYDQYQGPLKCHCP